MKILTLLLLFGISFSCLSQEDEYMKRIASKKGKFSLRDSTLVLDLTKAALDSAYSSTDKAYKYAGAAKHIAGEIKFYLGYVESCLALGVTKIYQNDYDSSLWYVNKALLSAKKHKLLESEIACYDMRGGVYSYMEKYDLAANDYLMAVKLAEKTGSDLIVKSYANLGFVYNRVGNLPKAEKYLKLSIDAGKNLDQPNAVASSLNNLGLIEKKKGNPDRALEYYFEGLKYASLRDFKIRKSELLYNISVIYFDKKEFDLAMDYFNQSLEISKENGSYLSNAINQLTLGLNLFEMGKKSEGYAISLQAAESAKLSGNHEALAECYKQLADLSFKLNKFDEAYTYLTYSKAYSDSLQFAEINDAISNTEHQYEQEKRELQIKLERAQEKKISEEKLWWRDLLLWISFAVLVVVVLGVYLLLKSNRKIKQKNEMVELQKSEIENQHREISDSILYARRIQQAILANPEQFDKLSPEAFTFFRPKDVISGDFYWIYNDDENQVSVWAVGDCTGHGVPGALMSMLGIGLLNEIVIEGRERDPGQILNQLRRKIVQALENERQSGANDGMDIALCVWDKKTNELLYAGANNQLWMIQKNPDSTLNSVLEVHADKMPVGKGITNPPPFSSKKIEVRKGDSIILCTDGFPDQFGGPQNKKYKYKQLKSLLLSLTEYPISEREKHIEAEFDAWKGSEEQTDDVCLFWMTIDE